MASKRRKERRERERLERERLAQVRPVAEKEHAPPAPPVLRLVRSVDTDVPGEPLPGGLASAPVLADRDNSAGEGFAGSQESRHPVVAAAAAAIPEPVPEPEPLTIRRSFDAADINPLINLPENFKTIAFAGMEPGHLDLGPVLIDTNNVLLMSDCGGILAVWHEPGVYEIHTILTPPQKGEGPRRMAFCKMAYHYMFTQTDCVTLLTKIPGHNRAAAIFAPLVGWTREFERKAIWPTVDGEMVDVGFYTMRYPDWVRKSPDLMASGKWFHARLDQEFARHGRTDKQHPDEDCHDLYVGSCVEMMRGGQFEKAIALYNGWASFSGYGLMAIVSFSPTIIDIGNALLQMTAHDFKVVKVK